MKNPIALLINDIHLNKENGNLIKDLINQVISVCKEYEINYLICGGDIFTDRSGQPLQCLLCWKEIIEILSKNNIFIHAIPGNHDKTDKDSKGSYLDIFANYKFTLHREGSCAIINGVPFAFIPYFSDEKWMSEYEKVEEIMDDFFIQHDVKSDSPRILITHSGFDGVMNNDGTKVESIIKPSMFKHYNKVLIGHYHNASKLADNVIYTGSLYQGDFGETYTDKGCTIIYDDGSISHVALKFPKYIKEIVDVKDTETIKNLIEKYEGETYDHVRFEFRGDKADAIKVNISELAAKGIDAKFVANETEMAIKTSECDEIIAYDKKTLIKDFTKFCSENKIKGDKLKYGLSLIKEL